MLLGNFSLLAVTPGTAVAAATQLIALRGLPALPGANGVEKPEDWHITADLEAHLAIRGLQSGTFSVPSSWPEDGRGLVAFAAGAPLEHREASPGYGGEVFALGCRFTQDDRSKIARTRYAEKRGQDHFPWSNEGSGTRGVRFINPWKIGENVPDPFFA